MSVQTLDHEPSLFDPKPIAAVDVERPQASPADTEATQQVDDTADDTAEEALEAASSDAADPAAQEADPDAERNDRKRLEEQLSALRRKEAELLRALAITDHPDLADAIRTIEARVYCVARADAKLAQGLSKSEARRQEVLTKKLTALREKRAELDAQIEALEAEFQELGAARMTDFQRERQDALQSLMVALAQHDAAIGAVGLDVRALLPEISPLLPELEDIARNVSESRADA